MLRSGMTIYFDTKGENGCPLFIDATPGMGGRSSGPRPGGMGMRGIGMRGMGMGGGRRYGGGSSQGQKEDANWYVFRLKTEPARH